MAVLPLHSIDSIQFGTPQAEAINGTANNDLIHAGAGADSVFARGGDDVVFGDRGGDSISAGQGDDSIVWTNGDGSDAIDGGSGNDTLVVEGSSNSERFTLALDNGDAVFSRTIPTSFQLDLQRVESVDLQALGGDDRLTIGDLSGSAVEELHFRGGDGADRVDGQSTRTPMVAEGEAGDDRLTGGSAADQLQGGNGNDTLQGNGGNDWLVGGNGDDTLTGGSGRDVLEGGAGDDQLTGGTGRDAFLFERNGGSDTISDFNSGNDVIVLKGFTGPNGGPLTFNQLSADITEQNGDSVIDVGNTSITVNNVTNLNQSDFAFV